MSTCNNSSMANHGKCMACGAVQAPINLVEVLTVGGVGAFYASHLACRHLAISSGVEPCRFIIAGLHQLGFLRAAAGQRGPGPGTEVQWYSSCLQPLYR
jgi:hypothetical protein